MSNTSDISLGRLGFIQSKIKIQNHEKQVKIPSEKVDFFEWLDKNGMFLSVEKDKEGCWDVVIRGIKEEDTPHTVINFLSKGIHYIRCRRSKTIVGALEGFCLRMKRDDEGGFAGDCDYFIREKHKNKVICGIPFLFSSKIPLFIRDLKDVPEAEIFPVFDIKKMVEDVRNFLK